MSNDETTAATQHMAAHLAKVSRGEGVLTDKGFQTWDEYHATHPELTRLKRHSRQFVVVKVSQACFDELAAAMRAGGHDHVFHDDGELDMFGFGIGVKD